MYGSSPLLPCSGNERPTPSGAPSVKFGYYGDNLRCTDRASLSPAPPAQRAHCSPRSIERRRRGGLSTRPRGFLSGTRTESNFGAAPPDFAHSFPKAARHYQPRPGSAYGRGMAGRTVSAPAGAVEHQFQLLQVDRCGWHNSDFHGGSGSIASQGSDTALQHVHAHHQSSAPRGRLHLGVANEPAFASSTPCSTPTLGCPERMTTDDATPTIENQPTFMNWSSDATASPVGIFQSQGTPLPALADGALPQIHRSALYRRRLRRNASIHAQESLVVAASRISLSEPRR